MKNIGQSEKEVKSLVVSYITGSISKDDLIRLLEWIHESKENRHYFNVIKNSWVLSGKENYTSKNVGDSWTRFKENRLSRGFYRPRKMKKSRMIKYLLTAASWLLFLVIGSGITLLVTNKPEEFLGKNIEIYSPLGSRSTIKMPDGTTIWLNAGTTITYDENYGKETRTLNLIGEAFFDVGKDKSHPFIVNSSGLFFRALGTKFNIKAYPDEKIISATLEEGAIDISMPSDIGKSKKVTLKPNEKLIYYKELEESESHTESSESVDIEHIKKDSKAIQLPDASILTNVKTELYTSWKDRRWIFEGEPLVTLVPMLERRYNIHIIFMDDELKNYKFSGSITNETVDQFLNAVQLTAPIIYNINKDTVRLILNRNYNKEFSRITTQDY